MAFNSYTVYRGPGERIGKSLFGVILAPVFIIGAAALLFYNESHAVKTADSLKEGAATVTEASATQVDSSREGKLVHVSGDAAAEGTLEDPTFGVSTPGIKLARSVEVYEWTESSHSSNNQTRYDYETKWQDRLVDSGKFKVPEGHRNPVALAYPAKTFQAQSVSVGTFQLDPDLVKLIGGAETLPLKEDTVTLPDGATLQPSGEIYVGKTPSAPAVGDLRITEKLTPAGPVSIIAAQVGSKLAPYHSHNGSEIALLEQGTQSAAKMFETAQTNNAILTWVIRAVGFVVLFMGIHFIFGPLSTLASFVPILGAIFEGGVWIISFLMAVVGWFVLVGAAWLTARPFIAIPLLIVAVLAVSYLIWLLLKRHAVRKARLNATPPVPA